MLGKNKKNTELYIKFINTDDDKYFVELYNNIYPYSYNMTRKYLYKKCFVDDIVNGAIEKIYTLKHTFDKKRKFNNWYLVILFNDIRNTNYRENKFFKYFGMLDEHHKNIIYELDGEELYLYENEMYQEQFDTDCYKDKIQSYVWNILIEKFISYIPSEYHEYIFQRYYYGAKPRELFEEGFSREESVKSGYYLNNKRSRTVQTMFLEMQNEIKLVEDELNIFWKK